MLRGVLWSIQERHLPRLVADIGGWSTEILWAEGETALETASLDLGVVAFTEKFFKQDPPLSEEVSALENRARKIIREVREAWEGKGRSLGSLQGHLVGTAGTATTLAAIDLGLAVYDPRKISGHRISSRKAPRLVPPPPLAAFGRAAETPRVGEGEGRPDRRRGRHHDPPPRRLRPASLGGHRFGPVGRGAAGGDEGHCGLRISECGLKRKQKKSGK